MKGYVDAAGLRIARVLHDLVRDRVAPGVSGCARLGAADERIRELQRHLLPRGIEDFCANHLAIAS